MNKTIMSVCVIAAFAAPAVASAQQGQANSSGTMTSNGSSTGVGNAGSFGIASGTSDSISTATATSNGVQDSSTHNDSGTHIATVSLQDLKAANSHNQITINAGANPASSPTPTSSNVVSGSSFSNYSGILANAWNTGPSGTAQAGTNIAVNGNFRPN